MEYGAKQNRAWRLWTDAVESCLREIYLAPAIIDYQVVSSSRVVPRTGALLYTDYQCVTNFPS